MSAAAEQIPMAEPVTEPVVMVQDVKEHTLEVVAPTNLAGGYEFFVNAGNTSSYKVRVPDGGVVAGERFHAAIISEVGDVQSAHNVPFGRWRDGLCDCCAFGCCHPMFCLTFWCFPCSLGQVLHRMKINANGKPTADGKYPATSAFKILFGLAILVCILQIIISFVGINVGGYVSLGFALYCFLLTMSLRSKVREQYNIPGSCCEDCCCSFWCLHCTICQLARHTADFKTHPAGCCTDKGLNPDAPDLV
jgi:Cys-rich protein (TIGR01571 family)